jgi:hypothetical protein
MSGGPFLPRAITPEPCEFDELNRYWSSPEAKRIMDEDREYKRRLAYNEWSRAFDEGRVA